MNVSRGLMMSRVHVYTFIIRSNIHIIKIRIVGNTHVLNINKYIVICRYIYINICI